MVLDSKRFEHVQCHNDIFVTEIELEFPLRKFTSLRLRFTEFFKKSIKNPPNVAMEIFWIKKLGQSLN